MVTLGDVSVLAEQDRQKTTSATQTADAPARNLFLSHTAADKPLARRIAADIEAARHAGRNLSVWLDDTEIPLVDILERMSLIEGWDDRSTFAAESRWAGYGSASPPRGNF